MTAEMLEDCFDRAEYLIQEAEQVPLPPGKKSTASAKWKSLRRKLRESYSEALQQPPQKRFRATSDILQNLAKKSNHTRIVVSLFPLNDGYSITLMKNDGTCAESLHMPYEENEILNFIDNEELPPLLVDTLHRSNSNAFHCGCVFAEVRDYRIATDQFCYETRYVLLKPTQQTLNTDVNLLAEETSNLYKWGTDDKLTLESYITLATSEPLCLDTSPTVAIIKNKLQDRAKPFGSRPFKKMIQRNSALMQKRREEVKNLPAPPELKLYDFLKKRKERKKDESTLSPDIKLSVDAVDIWRKTPLELSPPSEIPIENHTKSFSMPNDRSDDIIEVQSILLESEGVNREVCSKITIGQRPKDMHYFGMLQSNKYFRQNMDLRDSQSIFSLGTEYRANLYILQYQELFTEDGRRPAKVTVVHANKAPVVYHIPNQQQPWQLSQERSAYSVGSVINIPVSKWKKMNGTVKEGGAPLPESTPTTAKQIQKPQPQKIASAQVASTPTLNAITLQNSAQSAFNLPGSTVNAHRRLSKVKSAGSDNNAPQVLPTRRSSDLTGSSQARMVVTTRDTGGKLSTKTQGAEGGTQSYTLNSSALANALNQIGGTVSLQVPGSSSSGQSGQPTTTVLRMPVVITNTGSNTGQITTLNLLGGQNVLTSNVVGNIQHSSGGGSITIPASQLSANLAMQLTSVASGNQQQHISLVTAAPSTSQQISLVGQSGSNTPFAIVANNDNWQIQETISQSNQQQQTYSIAPRTQMLSANSRQLSNQQQPQVQVVQQLRIPPHLLNSLVNSSDVTQLVAASAKQNKKRRPTQE